MPWASHNPPFWHPSHIERGYDKILRVALRAHSSMGPRNHARVETNILYRGVVVAGAGALQYALEIRCVPVHFRLPLCLLCLALPSFPVKRDCRLMLEKIEAYDAPGCSALVALPVFDGSTARYVPSVDQLRLPWKRTGTGRIYPPNGGRVVSKDCELVHEELTGNARTCFILGCLSFDSEKEQANCQHRMSLSRLKIGTLV